MFRTSLRELFQVGDGTLSFFVLTLRTDFLGRRGIRRLRIELSSLRWRLHFTEGRGSPQHNEIPHAFVSRAGSQSPFRS